MDEKLSSWGIPHEYLSPLEKQQLFYFYRENPPKKNKVVSKVYELPPYKSLKERLIKEKKQMILEGGNTEWKKAGEGQFACRVCKSKGDVYYKQKQTRALDEAATVVIKCNRCNKQWRE